MCVHCGNAHKDGIYYGNMNKTCADKHSSNISAVGHCRKCWLTARKLDIENKKLKLS